MNKSVDFYFDFGSPAAYLAWTQLPVLCLDAYVTAMFQAIWVNARNMADPATVAEALATAGLNAAELMALAAEPQVKDRLRADTEAAVARGVFGAPTMFVGDNLYWGQDRLDFVREALSS